MFLSYTSISVSFFCPKRAFIHSPLSAQCMCFQLSEKEKRRSLLWHGFDRFSRKLRGELSPSCIVSPPHQIVHRTSSTEESRRTFSEDDSTPLRTVGSAGTKRRQLFTSSKQLSMPAEVSFSVYECECYPLSCAQDLHGFGYKRPFFVTFIRSSLSFMIV